MRVISIYSEENIRPRNLSYLNALKQICDESYDVSLGQVDMHFLKSIVKSGDVVVVGSEVLANQSARNNQQLYPYDKYEIREFQEEMRQRDIQIVLIRHSPRYKLPSYLEGIGLLLSPMFIGDRNHGEKIVRIIEMLRTIDLNTVNESLLLKIVELLLPVYGFRIEDENFPNFLQTERYDGIYSYRHKDPFGRILEEKWIVEIKGGEDISDARMFNRLSSLIYSRKEPLNVLYFTNSIINSRFEKMMEEFRYEARQRIRVVDAYELKQLLASNPKVSERVFNI